MASVWRWQVVHTCTVTDIPFSYVKVSVCSLSLFASKQATFLFVLIKEPRDLPLPHQIQPLTVVICDSESQVNPCLIIIPRLSPISCPLTYAPSCPYRLCFLPHVVSWSLHISRTLPPSSYLPTSPAPPSTDHNPSHGITAAASYTRPATTAHDNNGSHDACEVQG